MDSLVAPIDRKRGLHRGMVGRDGMFWAHWAPNVEPAPPQICAEQIR
jgi:hypothetical protein